MNQSTPGRSDGTYRSPPSLAVSLAFVGLTVAVVFVLSVAVAAPALVGAFVGGVVTALAASLVRHAVQRSSDAESDGEPDRREADRRGRSSGSLVDTEPVSR